MKEFKCHFCEKAINITQSRLERSKSKIFFCSHSCYSKNCRKNWPLIKCEQCGEEKRTKPRKEGRRFCSKECSREYHKNNSETIHNFINLEGKTFGDLKVLRKNGADKKGCAYFDCECSCGNVSKYPSRSLRDGIRKKCNECKKADTQNKKQEKKQKKEEERIKEQKEKAAKKKAQLEEARRKGKEDLERSRKEKEEFIKSSTHLTCIGCNKHKPKLDFPPSNLKKLYLFCASCNRSRLKKFYDEVYAQNVSKPKVRCKECKKKKKLTKYSKTQLKFKKCVCKKCLRIKRVKEGEILKKEREESGKPLLCSVCKETKTLDLYIPSYLCQTTPICRACKRSYASNYKKEKNKKDPIYKLKENIRRSVYKSLRQKGYRKDSQTSVILGISKDEFVKYIESQFREGMSWENRNEWQIDHITPLAIAETKEDVEKLWHYTNLQPLWAWENNQKKDRSDWTKFKWASDILEIRKKLGYPEKGVILNKG